MTPDKTIPRHWCSCGRGFYNKAGMLNHGRKCQIETARSRAWIEAAEAGLGRSRRARRVGADAARGASSMIVTDHVFEPGVDVDMAAEGREPSPLWCNICGEAASFHRDPTMLDIVRALSETYRPDGVARALAAPNKLLSPDAPLITCCVTVDGRRQVYAWAYSLGEMIAT